ncbi:hypothetical protein Goklo_024784 [Gossypium klotzschianum]|uniref:RNase H type-1 domain-containing protein n=1 Tax=Gossypium klotzschianum TaxID=34286 RepID=A0A7J8W629_9ROSI|nr:hypothetical protein [Gossypium klotzschianum]
MDLWSLNIPEKIKIHVWRLFNNLVPHYGNLARRTLCEEAVCPLCKADLENSEHLLWSCDILQDVWDVLQVQFPPFECSLGHKELLGFISGYEQELSNVNICPFTGSTVKELWRPPDIGDIKINFDASFIQDKSLATTAVLARDYKGEVVGAETYLFKDVADSFVTKARACERALVFACKLRFQRLVVEGDALSVIKNIRKKEADKWIIRPIIYHIHQLDRAFEKLTYIFVPREVNEAAHVLAMEGRRKGVCGSWVNDVPDLVQTVVRKDRFAWD